MILLGVVLMCISGCSYEAAVPAPNTDPSPPENISTTTNRSPWNAPPFEGAPPEEIVLARIDNTASAHNLISQIYSKETLLRYYSSPFYSSNTCMVNVDVDCKIECIRKADEDRYYTIHKSDDGGLLYLFFTRGKDGFLEVGGDTNRDTVLTNWYVSDEVRKSDFEKLILNSSTLSDVKKLDPYGYYPIDLYGKVSNTTIALDNSVHLTTDGYQVFIIYGWDDQDNRIATDVKIEEAGESSFYQQLLPMDRPENLLKTT